MPREPDLRFRFASALQQTKAQLEATGRRLHFQSGPGDQFGLVESSLSEFRGVQRDRHNQKFGVAKERLQIFNCFHQHAAQDIRRRSNLVIFEQMNEFTQTALIAAVGCCFDVRRFETAAQSTPSLARFRRITFRRMTFGRESEGAYKPFATDGTESARDWQHCSKTIFTNWQP